MELDQKREQLCKEFTLLTGGHWHEIVQIPAHVKDGIRYTNHTTCSCRKDLLYFSNLETHIKESNPTYENPTDVLNVLVKTMETDNWWDFVAYSKAFIVIGEFDDDPEDWAIKSDYILKKDALLEEAVNFLRKRKKNER